MASPGGYPKIRIAERQLHEYREGGMAFGLLDGVAPECSLYLGVSCSPQQDNRIPIRVFQPAFRSPLSPLTAMLVSSYLHLLTLFLAIVLKQLRRLKRLRTGSFCYAFHIQQKDSRIADKDSILIPCIITLQNQTRPKLSNLIPSCW